MMMIRIIMFDAMTSLCFKIVINTVSGMNTPSRDL